MNYRMKPNCEIAIRLLLMVLLTFTISSSSYCKSYIKPNKISKEFTFVVFGDTRSNPSFHRDVVNQIISVHPDFIIQTGDLVSDGKNKAQWDEFKSIESPIQKSKIDYYSCRGNHDLGGYYHLLDIGPHDSGGNDNYYYSFTRYNNRFIVLDSLDPDQYNPLSIQYKWLVKELASLHKHYDHTFVIFHESPFSVGPHGPTPEAVKYLHPLFVKFHVTAVFCGHDHLYYRTKRDGIYYVLTGGGGAPLYNPENNQLAVNGDVYAKAHHYVKVVVNGKSLRIYSIKAVTGDPLEVNYRTMMTSKGETNIPITSNIIDDFSINP